MGSAAAESSLFLAAFLAGVAEGNSVLNYYHDCYCYQTSASTASSSSSPRSTSRNRIKPHSSSSASSASSSFLIPSFIYGGLAFPMSLIGESPGPELLAACIPSVRKMLVPILLDQTLPSSSNNNKSKKVSPVIPRLHNNSQQSSQQEENKNFGESTSKSMIDFARTANRGQKTTITNQSPGIFCSHHSNSRSKQPWSRFASTLDSRYSTILPTPKAELLRRVRLILFGAGLVSTYITHHILKHSTTRSREEQVASTSKQTLNKPIHPLDRFLFHPAKNPGRQAA